jgi:cellulose synthase/poly-beta-1,6-N-acetylglucosamine synthase-like glycosyltransferase
LIGIFKIIFCVSLFLAIFAYLLYPITLFILVKARRLISKSERAIQANGNNYSISVIIAVRNEEKIIREKLENTLLLKARLLQHEGEVEIIVASDGSEDLTNQIVREYQDRGIELVFIPKPCGKESAQREAIKHATGDIIVFTDARSMLDTEALKNILKYFLDDAVGAVSSVDRMIDDGKSGSGERLYLAYEMCLRRLESEYFSLIGLSGSCFAVRRDICEDLRVNIPSDFSLLIRAREKGLRGVQADDVICSYKSVGSDEKEFRRKIRTVLRGMTAFFSNLHIIKPIQDFKFTFLLLSHKLMRWLAPVFLLVAFIISYILFREAYFYSIFFILGVSFILVAVIGYVLPGLRKNVIVKAVLFFAITNLAVLVAWWKYIRGDRVVSWTPSSEL